MTVTQEAYFSMRAREIVREHIESVLFATDPVPSYFVDVSFVSQKDEDWRMLLESNIVEDTIFEVRWYSQTNGYELAVYKKAEAER